MPHMLYAVTGRDTVFNGENDFEDMRKGVTSWQGCRTSDPEERLLYKIFQNY